jgi:hypothetical protein
VNICKDLKTQVLQRGQALRRFRRALNESGGPRSPTSRELESGEAALASLRSGSRRVANQGAAVEGIRTEVKKLKQNDCAAFPSGRMSDRKKARYRIERSRNL